MKLEILNYDRSNHDHLDWAIALRDCVRYAMETGSDMISALKNVGFNDNQIHRDDTEHKVNVVVLDLTDEQREALVIERQRIKDIRRGA